MGHTLRSRVGVGLAAASIGVLTGLSFTGPAAAHVTVNPSTAVQGGFAKLAFRVPNEKDTADTVRVEINVPTDKPISFVSVKPITGWTAQVDKTKLDTPIKSEDGEVTEAVSKITWSAAGEAAIRAGQFQEFEISAGPLPDATKVAFKALQTYSDGEVVRWIEEGSDGKEPEHPAPTLTLTKKPAGSTGDTHNEGGNAVAADDHDDDNGGHTVAVVLGSVGLVAGLGGLVLGFLAYRRTAPL